MGEPKQSSVCWACGRKATRKGKAGFVCGTHDKFGCEVFAQSVYAGKAATIAATPNYYADREKTYKDTCIRRYGVTNAAKTAQSQQRREATVLRNHGKSIREILREARDKQCSLHGVRTVWQLPSVREKAANTNLKRFGTRHAAQAPSIKRKTRKTIETRYGIHPMRTASVKRKRETTCLKRYGVRNVMFNSTIAGAQQRKRMKKKPLVLPSGMKVWFQGYEDRAILRRIKGLNENDFLFNGALRFTYTKEEGGTGVYIPDFAIQSQRIVVEVKSEFTVGIDRDLYRKLLAVSENGWTPVVEVWGEPGKGGLLHTFSVADIAKGSHLAPRSSDSEFVDFGKQGSVVAA